MTKLNFSRNEFSEIFWKKIFNNGAVHLAQAKADIASNHGHFEALRQSARYNTGSIPLASAVSLVMIANYFKPSLIAEVGTFIGRSTFSLALGSYLGGVKSPQIHTCDYSNDIELDFRPTFDGIQQYKLTSSTEMLARLLKDNLSPEMYFLDGRLQDEDLHILSNLTASNAIILLDDFEGIEKGVANAVKIGGYFKENFTIAYPPSETILRLFGLQGWCSVAALIPKGRISWG